MRLQDVTYHTAFDEDCWKITALFKKRSIGYLKANPLDDGRILLGDICIYPESHHRSYVRWWKRPFVRTKFRGYAVGKELMKMFLNKAKREDFDCVVGNITEDAPKETDYLLAWYTRLGFYVKELPSDERQGFKYSMELRLV